MVFPTVIGCTKKEIKMAEMAFLRRVCGEATEQDADRVLLLAQQPDYFLFEGENDERRELALGVLGTLAMPEKWTEKARRVLQDIAAHDSPRCQKGAQEALAQLRCRENCFKRAVLAAWQSVLRFLKPISKSNASDGRVLFQIA